MKKILLSSLLLAITIVTSAQEVSKDLIKKAKDGDIEAQLNLGKAYIESSENAQAAKWLYSAAESGNKDAEKLLFTFYSKELEKYAKTGNADAQYHLGLCYLNGSGVKTDTEKAATLFESAMLQGQKEAGQAFFSFESKLKSKRVKTLRVNPMMVYTGYATPDKSTGYNIDKSPVAEVSLGRMSNDGSRMENEYVNIKGEKEGDKFMNTTLISKKLGIAYMGDIIMQSVSEMNPATKKHTRIDTKITFLPGGELIVDNQKIILDKNFSILIDELKNSLNMEGSIQSIHKGVTLSSEAVSNLINDNFKNKYASAIKFIGANNITVDLRNDLGFGFGSDSRLRYSSSLATDTLRIGNYALYPQNGKAVLADTNSDDIIVWDDNDNVEVFHKIYKDGIVKFNSSSESYISFFNKENFKGKFYLGSLKPENNSFLSLKDLWLGERINDFPFTICEGDYTDEKGNIEHWVRGFPEKTYEEYSKQAEENAQKRALQAINDLKSRRDKAKETLIKEGFDQNDVKALLDRCVIYNGMSRRLIQRAHELNSNLHIEHGKVTLGGNPRQLIKIIDAETGGVMFYAFVGYNIFNQVYAVETH